MLAVAVRGAQKENFSNGQSKCMVYDLCGGMGWLRRYEMVEYSDPEPLVMKGYVIVTIPLRVIWRVYMHDLPREGVWRHLMNHAAGLPLTVSKQFAKFPLYGAGLCTVQ